MGVGIVTDSVACLPEELADRCGITVVPLQVIIGDKTYLDGIDITPSQFYQILAKSKVAPTTSAPPPETYLKAYEKIAEKGQDLLVICPSIKLTHVYESARLAADMLKEKFGRVNIEVLDTGTAAGSQGMVALDAAGAAMSGMRLEDVVNVARESMKEVHLIAFLDTLTYLARSGRVPLLLAWANALLNIKPIIEVLPLSQGVVPVTRVRTRTRAMGKVVEILKKRSNNLPLRVIIQHSDAEEEADELAGEIRSKLGSKVLYIKDFTPVIGVHTGPGLVGVSYSTYKNDPFEK